MGKKKMFKFFRGYEKRLYIIDVGGLENELEYYRNRLIQALQIPSRFLLNIE